MDRLVRNAAEAAGGVLLVVASGLVYLPAGLAAAGVALILAANVWRP